MCCTPFPVSPPKKDFARLNIRHLRQLQLDTKRKKEECDKPAVRSSHSKYDHIAAKVTAHMGGSHAPPCKETSPGSGESHRKSPRVEERPLSDERGSKVKTSAHGCHTVYHIPKKLASVLHTLLSVWAPIPMHIILFPFLFIEELFS